MKDQKMEGQAIEDQKVKDQKVMDTFCHGDLGAARHAFDSLCARSRRFLYAFLQRRFSTSVITAEDRNDIVQATFLKVWDNRLSFRNQGIAAWFAFLRTTVYRVALDYLATRHGETLTEDIGAYDIEPADDGPENEIIARLSACIEAGRLIECADAIWLGMDLSVPTVMRNRQVRAAYHFYLRGASYEQIARLLPPLSPQDCPLTREVLDEWLSDPAVLRAMAYRDLYFSNDRLACHLLNIGSGCTAARLDELMGQALAESRMAEGTATEAAMEIAVLLWRYRFALLAEQIARLPQCGYTGAQLDDLIVRSTQRLPFSDIMARLCAKVGDARTLYGTRALWQRLAFQYRYWEELPHRDIQERIQPAATHVSFNVTLATLNGWLSNGTLLQQLANSYTVLHGDERHG